MITIKNAKGEVLITIPRFELHNLEGQDLEGAELEGVVMQSQGLSGTNFKGANLKNSDLRNADLQEADLEDANLEGVNLGGTDLRYTWFKNTNLKGADLNDAVIHYPSFEGVIFDDNTIIPTGETWHSYCTLIVPELLRLGDKTWDEIVEDGGWEVENKVNVLGPRIEQFNSFYRCGLISSSRTRGLIS